MPLPTEIAVLIRKMEWLQFRPSYQECPYPDYNRHLKLPRQPDSPRPSTPFEPDHSPIASELQDQPVTQDMPKANKIVKKRHQSRKAVRKEKTSNIHEPKGAVSTSVSAIKPPKNRPSFPTRRKLKWTTRGRISKRATKMRFYLKNFNFMQEVQQPAVRDGKRIDNGYQNFLKLYKMHWGV